MKNDPLIDYKYIYIFIYILLFVIIRWYHSMVCQKSAVRLTKLDLYFWYFLLNLGTCWVPGWHVDGPWVGRAIHGTDLLHLQCHYQIWRIVVTIGLLTLGPKTCCFKDDRNYSRNFLVPSNIIKPIKIMLFRNEMLDNGRPDPKKRRKTDASPTRQRAKTPHGHWPWPPWWHSSHEPQTWRNWNLELQMNYSTW